MTVVSGAFLSTKGAPATPPDTPTLAQELRGPRVVRPPAGSRVRSTRDPLHANPVDPREAPQAIMALAKGGNSAGERKAGSVPNQSRVGGRERSSGSIFRSIIGAPLSGTEIVIAGDSTLPVPPKPAPILKNTSGITRSLSKGSRKQKGLRGDSSTLKISGPVKISGTGPSIKTIDLAQAAERQRQRQQQQQANRDRYLEAGLLTPTRKAPNPPSLASAEYLQKRANTARRDIASESPNRRPPVPPVPRLSESDSILSTSAVSASLQLKGLDEMRRRSPRTSEYPEEGAQIAATVTYGLPSHVKLTQRSAGFAPPMPAPTVPNGNLTAMKSGLNVVSAVILAIPSPTGLPTSAMSIMERKGPNVDKRADRTIFPTRESHLKENLRSVTPLKQQPEIVNMQKSPQLSAVPTAAAKLEPLIPEGVDDTKESLRIEHKFPAPPSSLQLPRFTEFSIPQIPFIDGSPAKSAQRDVTNNDEVPLTPSVSLGARSPLEELVDESHAFRSATQRSSASLSSSRGSAQAPPRIPTEWETQEGEADGEARRQSDSIEQMDEDGGTSSGNDDDFEMDIPIKLGYNVRSVARPKKWHYRVGDTTPLFSERRRQKGSNTMPPPVPLLLQPAGRHAKAVTRARDGLEAERARDKELREQQDTFGSTDRESFESSVGRGETDSGLFRGRRTLLDKIERELNMKEQDWLQLQGDLNDSSTSSTTWDLSSYPSLSPRSILIQQRLSSNGDRQFRFKSSNLNISISAGIYEDVPLNKPLKHLSEPPSDYTRRAPNTRVTSFLTIDNYRVEVSPTPPDSERTMSYIDVDLTTGADLGEKPTNEADSSPQHSPAASPAKAYLWRRRSVPQQVTSRNFLWEATPPKSFISEEVELPASYLRPTQRRLEAPLRIFSSQLWTKPEPKPTRVVDLWGQTFYRPKNVTPIHRASQKPPRKTKRMTFLPDIVENPEPLPGRTGALGIFQGPWGPTDSAWPPILRLSAAITNAQKPRIVVEDADDPSFYDDHDDGDDFDEDVYNAIIDDVYGNNSGDGVEDPVVWELLGYRRDVLGGGSVFPLKSVIVEDDGDDDDDDDEGEDSVHGDEGVHGKEDYGKAEGVTK